MTARLGSRWGITPNECVTGSLEEYMSKFAVFVVLTDYQACARTHCAIGHALYHAAQQNAISEGM